MHGIKKQCEISTEWTRALKYLREMAISSQLHDDDMEVRQVLDNIDDQLDGLQGVVSFLGLLNRMIKVFENKDSGLHFLAVVIHDKIKSELA